MAMRSTMRKRGTLKPADLNGKRVGIRSFTTTTGAWLRGILANDYGVDLNSIDWVTFEDAHVAEFRDTTKRAPAGKQIIQMLLDGELDAVLGEKVGTSGPEAAVRRCRRGRESLVRKAQGGADQPYGGGEPGAVARSIRTPCGKSIACCAESAEGVAAAPRFTADEMRRSLELIIRYTAQQGLIPRAFAVDELFDDVTRALLS